MLNLIKTKTAEPKVSYWLLITEMTCYFLILSIILCQSVLYFYKQRLSLIVKAKRQEQCDFNEEKVLETNSLMTTAS